MPNDAERRVRQSYRGRRAERLLDAYFRVAGHTYDPSVGLREPEEWAGWMLVLYGRNAIEKIDELLDTLRKADVQKVLLLSAAGGKGSDG